MKGWLALTLLPFLAHLAASTVGREHAVSSEVVLVTASRLHNALLLRRHQTYLWCRHAVQPITHQVATDPLAISGTSCGLVGWS